MTVPVARYFNSKNVYSIFQQSRKASLLFTTRQVAHSAPVTSKEEKQQSTYLQQSSTTQNIIRKSEWLAAEWRFCFLNEGGAACFFAIVGIVGAVPPVACCNVRTEQLWKQAARRRRPVLCQEQLDDRQRRF